MIKPTELTNEQLLEITNKLYARTVDIQKIGGFGYKPAKALKDKIRNQLVDEGWALPPYQVPMDYVLDEIPHAKRRLERLKRGGVANAG